VRSNGLSSLGGGWLSSGSPHSVVGAREKLFRHSSLEAAVCNFGSSYTRKLAESGA
jgi:hypothetical protein